MNEQNQEERTYHNAQNPLQQNPYGAYRQKQGVFIWATVALCVFMVLFATIGIIVCKRTLDNYIALKIEGFDADDGEDAEPLKPTLPIPDEDIGRNRENEELEEWEKLLKVYSEAENPFLDKEYVSHMGTDHINRGRSEFKNQYYEAICDSVTEEVSYQIKRDYYTYASENANAQIHVSCVSLEGDLPNREVLNRAIYDKTMFLAKVYLENYQNYVSENGINIMVDSYVTYNDESKLSIVLDEYYIIEKDVNIDLYCINIDLESGMILNNAKILDYNEMFAKEFKEKSVRQNGENTVLENMDIDDLLLLLQDEYNNIIFYTPMGMELGINYVISGTSGWITVTYPDYRRYEISL